MSRAKIDEHRAGGQRIVQSKQTDPTKTLPEPNPTKNQGQTDKVRFRLTNEGKKKCVTPYLLLSQRHLFLAEGDAVNSAPDSLCRPAKQRQIETANQQNNHRNNKSANHVRLFD